MILYGIKNCDTVRKARKWLDNNNIDYHFHDFRDDGLDPKRLQSWIQQAGYNTVVNKKSTRYRQFDDTQKILLADPTAIQLLLEYPTLIKRPVLEQKNGEILIGFSEKHYQKYLLTQR